MLLQPLWNFVLGHASLLRSPFFPVLFSLSVYLAFCLPFLLLDALSCRWAVVRRYKLQPQSSISWASVRMCVTHKLLVSSVMLLIWI